MRNERAKNAERIEEAVAVIRAASENLDKSICLLHGIIGRMDAVEAYAALQREKFFVVGDTQGREKAEPSEVQTSGREQRCGIK